MATLAEGQVGFARSDETLVYPEVSSCLTVTCVTTDGAKWGAHLSRNQMAGRLPYGIMLPELRTMISNTRALDLVKVVWVTGELGNWTTSLKPTGSQQTGAIRITENTTLAATRDSLVQLLGLSHLSGQTCSTVPGATFMFMTLNGEITFPAADTAIAPRWRSIVPEF